MTQFINYAMPMYSQDHDTYCRQMYEWHMKMHHYQEQLRSYHLERAKFFQGLAGEREKEKSNNDPAA
ncbi:hypothetical protein [Paenibacillus mendelii]|uniref:Cytosolic protein n=1 Tax=Paenibacillus mendelii TaxID=206163 RepID=A0ABV6J986_9BACL|nr:hypothetical protein [Paenibacillus mendelii]MCQ6559771.1 hypothetical protein [Paenibacillus mendelii]